MYWKVIPLLAALFVIGNGAPLTIESPNVCSTTCSEPKNLFYEIGKTYIYDFDTKTELKLEDQLVNVRITGQAYLNYARKCEFRLQLKDVRVEGVDKKQLRAAELEREILTFSFDDGLITNVCPSLNERSNILNIKKAILSAMQISTNMLGGLKMVDERDVLGDCETTYSEMNPYDKSVEQIIMKKKNLKTCRNRMIAKTALFHNAILERVLEQSSEVIQDDYECKQTIRNDHILKSVECIERSQNMQYSRESAILINIVRIEESSLPEPKEFKKQSLLYTREDDHITNIQSANNELKLLCNSVLHDISEDSMKYFKRLSYALKGLEYEDINRMLSQVQMEGGIGDCRSMKLHGLLESALLMSAGKGSLRYMTEDINSFDMSNSRKMMTLLSLPFVSQPTEESVKALLPMMNKIKSPHVLMLATAMIGNFVRNNNTCPSLMPAVKEAVTLLGERLPNKCIGEMNNEDIVAYLRAIGNIGYMTPEVFQKIVGCAKSTQTETNIRAAALIALKKSRACLHPSEMSDELKTLLNILLTRADETDEVQIAAFKTFMSCDKGLGEDFIIREAILMSKNKANPRLAYYVRSYLTNLQKNKNPMYRKMKMELISKDFDMINDEETDEKMSFNKLYTYYSTKLQMGIHYEIDYIIEKKMKNPRAILISAYIPIHERNIQLFEIGLRQDIDDESITKIEKLIKEQNFEELIKMAKDFMTGDRWSDATRERMLELERQILKLKDNIKMLSMHFDYNENTLFYGSYSSMEKYIKHQFKRAAWGGFAQGRGRPSFLGTINADHPIVHKMRNVFKERGYGLILMDSSIEIPTVSGLPVIAAARSIFISGSTGVREKQNMVNLLPNFGINFCASIKTFVNPEDMVGFKWKTTAVSNLRMIVKITNTDIEKSIELNLPSAKTDLLKFTSAVYVDTELSEKMFTYNLGMQRMCYPDMFGLTACMINHMSPEIGLRSQKKFVISLEHSDIKTEGWKATFVHPNSKSNRFMIELRAPRRNNNFIKLEALETLESDNWMNYDIRFKTENKKISGLFGYKLTENSINLKAEYNNDNEKMNGELLIEETKNTRNFLAYAIKLNANGGSYFEPFEMLYSSELKNEIQKKSASTELILTRKGSRMRLLKANIDMDENMRTAIHLQIGNLKINRWFSMSTVMQMNDYLSIDSSMEYKTIQMTKTQKISLHGKFHDKSNNILARIESMFEMTFSQWPEYNVHLNHTFMFKPFEHIENEFNLKWKGKMDSEKRMIHILQISKKLPISSDGTQIYENSLMYTIGPKAIKEELTHKATHRSGDLGLFKHEIKMVDLMTDKVYEGSLMYERVSRSPMKMLGNLWWKCPTGEKRATYEFIEMSPNKFKESITLKDHKNGQNPTGYILQTMLSTAERPNLDGQISISRIESNEQIALFKINALFGKIHRVKSDLVYKSKPVFEFEHFFDIPNKDLKQKLIVNKYGKIEAEIDFKTDVGTYKLDAECYICKSEHHTEFQVFSNSRHPEYGFRLKSKTLHKENLVYSLSMRKAWHKAFVFDLFNDNANLKIEHIPLLDGYRYLILFQDGDLYHKTTISKDELTTHAMSQTKLRGQMLFDAKYKRINGQIKVIKVDIPENFHLNYELTDDHKHLLKMSHPKSNLLHETTFAHNSDAYDFDLRSKTLKDSDNIYDMKVLGKYETTDKYDLKTTVNVMKRLRFNFGMKSSPNTKDMNVRLHDSLISSKPVNYEMRALQSRRKREVSVQNGDSKYGIKSYTDDDKSFNVEIRSPGVLSRLKLQERDFKFTIDSEFIQHETSLSHDSEGSNFLTSTVLGGKNQVFLIKRRRTETKRDTEMDNPFFKLHFIGERVSPKEDRVNLEWTNKHAKQSRKLTLVRLEENEKLIVTLDLLWDISKPSKAYNLRVEAPIKYEKELEIKFHSKGLLGCESDGGINYEYPNYKIKYDRKCADKTTNIKMEREVTGNNYHHILDVKVNGKDSLNIDTKAKVSDDHKTLTIKSQVKSNNKNLDGAYFDYKREWNEDKDGVRNLKVNMAFKPIFAEKLLTMNLDATYKKGSRVHVIRTKAVGTLEYLKTGLKYKREFEYENENIFHTCSKLTKEEGGKVSLISQRTIHLDKPNGIGYIDVVFSPTNSMANFSVKHTEGECDVSIVGVHRNVDLIRYESQRRKNGDEEDVNGKGTILGYPVSVKMSQTPEKTNFKMSVKPLPADYPYKVSEKYRMTDCYEPSEEDCINVRYEIDNVKHKLNTIAAKVKINDRGDRFTKTYLYENLDSGDRRERKLTVSNDKEKSTVGYHYIRQPGQCDGKIFLREGRVIRYLRNSKSEGPRSYNAKIEAWLDFERKPSQRLTIERKVKADDNSDRRETTISHPSLKKPITLLYDEKKEGEDVTAKVEFDYSEDPNNKLFLDIEAKVHDSSTETSKDYNVRLHRADNKIDVSSRQFTLKKFTELLTIRNMLKSTEWKSETGELLSVIQKFDYKKTIEDGVVRISRHIINKRLSHYFEMESETGANSVSEIERMDFTFKEGGPKYRLNSSDSEVENGRCLKFNAFQLPAGSGPMKYARVCFRPRRSDERLFDITAGDEATDSKTIDFAITRKPNAERMFIVSLKWNPERVKDRITLLIQKATERYNSYRKAEEDLKKEKERIQRLLLEPIAKALEPFGEHLSNEFQNICRENPRYCQVLSGKIRAKRRAGPPAFVIRSSESSLVKFLKMMSTFRMVSYNPQHGEVIFEIGIPN